MRASGNDAALEGNGLRPAGFLLRGAAGFFDLHMVGTDEGAVAANHGDLAHLGHGGQPAGELADHFFLVTAQRVNVHFGRPKINAECRHVADLVDHGGHMQQRLGRDAAHVQADATELGVALDQHHFQAEVSGAKRCTVAARAGAEHQQVAGQIGGAGKTGRNGRWRSRDKR